MADDKSNRGLQDRGRIDINEYYEVRYWCGKFLCTREQLKAAVRKVGVMAADVEAELKRSFSTVDSGLPDFRPRTATAKTVRRGHS